MGQRDDDASRSLCHLSRQITLLCTYFKNTESRVDQCSRRTQLEWSKLWTKNQGPSRNVRDFWKKNCGLNICDCNETGYLDQAIEVLRDIERCTVLVSGGTAQVKEVFEQVKVVVA